MNSILIGIILAGLGLGPSWYYRSVAIESKAFCQSELARINAKSAAFKKSSEVNINDIETQRISDEAAADNRVQQLAKRQGPVVTSCTTSAGGVVSAGISADAVRLLRDTANDNRIPKASDPSGFIGPGEAVTADSVAAYCFYAITEYNDLAADYNALGKMVK